MAALDKRSTGVGGEPALLVVDASVGFTEPNCALGSSFDSEVAAIGRLLERFRDRPGDLIRHHRLCQPGSGARLAG